MGIYKETILGDWVIARIGQEMIEELLPSSIEHTAKKVDNSMDQGQDGRIRPQDVKFQKQLMGTLAEKATAKYLQRVLEKTGMNDEWQAIVYDDVREDFTYSTDEYDIKIVSRLPENEKEFVFESRSSIVYDRSFEVAMRNYHIIGPYYSDSKTTESLRDFYARPLYVYEDFKTDKYLPSRFQDLLTREKIVLYIVGGCNRREMEEKGYKVDMRQGNTDYKGVDITAGHDADNFGQLVVEELNKAVN